AREDPDAGMTVSYSHRSRRRSARAVLVVPAPPWPGPFVASLRRAVEPLIHAPQAVHAARIRGIRVIDDAVVEHERADTGPLPRVRRRVGSAHVRERARALAAAFPRTLAPVVVVDPAVALLRLREPDAVVRVEVAAERRGPRERPPHALLVRLQLRERRA